VIVAIPEVLREKLGPEGARALADLLNEASVKTRGDVIELAVSRFESRLAEEIGALRAEFGVLRGEFDSKIGGLSGEFDSKIGELRGEFGVLRGEFDSKIGELRGDLNADRGRFEGRMTRWMFVFWIGQIGVLLALFFAFFRA
jgi:hypothetical protein